MCMRSLTYYFGVYLPHTFTTREINTKTKLSWPHKQFTNPAHTFLSISWMYKTLPSSCYSCMHKHYCNNLDLDLDLDLCIHIHIHTCICTHICQYVYCNKCLIPKRDSRYYCITLTSLFLLCIFLSNIAFRIWIWSCNDGLFLHTRTHTYARVIAHNMIWVVTSSPIRKGSSGTVRIYGTDRPCMWNVT